MQLRLLFQRVYEIEVQMMNKARRASGLQSINPLMFSISAATMQSPLADISEIISEELEDLAVSNDNQSSSGSSGNGSNGCNGSNGNGTGNGNSNGSTQSSAEHKDDMFSCSSEGTSYASSYVGSLASADSSRRNSGVNDSRRSSEVSDSSRRGSEALPAELTLTPEATAGFAAETFNSGKQLSDYLDKIQGMLNVVDTLTGVLTNEFDVGELKRTLLLPDGSKVIYSRKFYEEKRLFFLFCFVLFFCIDFF